MSDTERIILPDGRTYELLETLTLRDETVEAALERGIKAGTVRVLERQ